MTDGHTGIQVAPITEDDMNMVRGILNRAADAIVGASQMANDIEAMRAELNMLRSDIDKLRNHNNALEEALSHSREMRDNQARELASTKDQLTQVEHERDNYRFDLETTKRTLDNVQHGYDNVAKERDQWADEADKLQRELDTAKAQLDKIKDVHASIFGASAPAMPTPTPPAPEPAPPLPPAQAITDTPHWPSEPSPIAEFTKPVPVEDTSLDWKPGYSWDHTRGLYVKQVA